MVMNNSAFRAFVLLLRMHLIESKAHQFPQLFVNSFLLYNYGGFSVLRFLNFTRYYRMCEAAQVGLGRNASVHSIHGSLLAVGELLR
jgi:hypothetical protein